MWPVTYLQMVDIPRYPKSSNKNKESWDLGNYSGIRGVPKIGYAILGTPSGFWHLHEAARERDVKGQTRGPA